MADKTPMREYCRLCHRVSRVGFHVPDEVWAAVALRGREYDPICLACFTELADEQGVRWDTEITFYPVSWLTHLAVARDSRVIRFAQEVR